MATNDKSVAQLVAELEVFAYGKQTTEAVNTLCELLKWLERVNKSPEHIPSNFVRNSYYLDFSAIVNRATSAWLSLVLDDDTDFTHVPISSLLSLLHLLHELYMSTTMKNTDYAINVLHNRTKGNYDPKNLVKLLLLFTPNTRSGVDIRSFTGSVPLVAYAQLLAIIGANNFIEDKTHQYRNQVLDFLADDAGFQKHGPDLLDLGAVLFESAYMHCSYSDKPDKHRVKQAINKVIQRTHAAPIARLRASVQTAEHEKPVLAVLIEVMREGHSMARCFAKFFANMKKRFRIVGISWTNSVDEGVAALFDEFVYFPDRVEKIVDYIEECGKVVQSVKPDILYYPSVGMRYYAILLSNYRLCDIQVMQLGHPATSGKSEIDYVMAESELLVAPELFTEKILPLESGMITNEKHKDQESVEPNIRTGAQTVRVAISALSMKLSYPFIQMLKELEDSAEKEIEFNFFTGKSGSTFVLMNNLLQRTFNNVKVHSQYFYKDYLNALNECDVYASSVPFGGTNSILDAFHLGLPVVSLSGRETHSLVDKMFTEKLGISYRLAVDTPEEYISVLRELVDDEETRVRVSEEILASRLDDELYAEEVDDYTEALFWLYNNHERIQDSGQQVWSPADRK